MDGTSINPCELLNQLEEMLDSDPCIDEVGFIHPSQFSALFEENCNFPASNPSPLGSLNTYFWTGKHKLGISSVILLPLYLAAKDAFMGSFSRYKKLRDFHALKDGFLDVKEVELSEFDVENLESEMMKHSRALLLLSCDFGTAWNSRRIVISKKQHLQAFIDELTLSTLVLSYAPKSERAWSHRRWVIKMLASNCMNIQDIVKRESELVKTLAESSKMNYRAWNHRCWLVSYMTHEQVYLELQNSRDWYGLHVADNSSFHYRTRLLLQMVEILRDNRHSDATSATEFHKIWKEELTWIGLLIRRYIGREALWLHRRFLSLYWIKHLTSTDQHTFPFSSCKSCDGEDVGMFIEDELKLLHSCTVIPDSKFNDYEAQKLHSCTYIMWLATQMPAPLRMELQNNPHFLVLEPLIKKTVKDFLWDSFVKNCRTCKQLFCNKF